MSWNLKSWYRNRILQHEGVPDLLWQRLVNLRCLRGLSPDELAHLRDCVTLFLHAKQIVGAHDLEITDEMQVAIAIQACILILYLDLDYYDNWVEIIVYPGEFIRDYDYADNDGVVHHVHTTASGESWLAGPVILSWQDIAHAVNHPGHNVVIHEFAHKLDMLGKSLLAADPVSRPADRPEQHHRGHPPRMRHRKGRDRGDRVGRRNRVVRGCICHSRRCRGRTNRGRGKGAVRRGCHIGPPAG